MQVGYLLELPAVGHGGHELCELLLAALQHAVHVLDAHLAAGNSEKERNRQVKSHTVRAAQVQESQRSSRGSGQERRVGVGVGVRVGGGARERRASRSRRCASSRARPNRPRCRTRPPRADLRADPRAL